jgi:acyl-CoA thioester hydrolase
VADEFIFPINVRYMEVDQQGVVFNAWYLTYYDDAMTALLNHSGLPYQRMLDAGYDVQLVRSEIDYRAGVRWGEIEVAVSTSRLGRTSFDLDFQIRQNGEVCTNARTVYVVIATDGSGKRERPDLITDALGTVRALF